MGERFTPLPSAPISSAPTKQVLQAMAKRLPQGSFQKLGLSVDSLKTAFSSLTSDLTTMRTEGGSSPSLTPRSNRSRETDAHRNMQQEGNEFITEAAGWDIYVQERGEVIKLKYDARQRALVEVNIPRPLT